MAAILSMTMVACVQSISNSDDNRLSEEQINQLRTEAKGRHPNSKVIFTASFRPQSLSPQERRRYRHSGKIPFQIIADYQEHRTDRHGRAMQQRLTGRVHLYVLDAEGNMVANRTLPVERMCPT